MNSLTQLKLLLKTAGIFIRETWKGYECYVTDNWYTLTVSVMKEMSKKTKCSALILARRSVWTSRDVARLEKILCLYCNRLFNSMQMHSVRACSVVFGRTRGDLRNKTLALCRSMTHSYLNKEVWRLCLLHIDKDTLLISQRTQYVHYKHHSCNPT